MDYWRRRMLAAQRNYSDKSINAVNKQLTKYYANAMQSTIKDFEAVYDKVLNQAEEGKPVTAADLYKLDKYYQMQAQLNKRLQSLGDKQCNVMSKQFEAEYRHIYVALSDDKQAITAMVSDAAFNTINEQAAARVAQEIWCADGKSWSTRVWNNISDLQQTLNDSLIDCIVSGKKTTQLKQTLMERFNVSYHRAETITRTEIAHIETQAAKDRYKSYGVQQVEILADTDSRTCDICARLDKKKFNINAQIPIPAHPNCRCCIIPVIDTKRTDDIMINNPIEQRNTGKGKANAVWSYGVPLNNRQQKLLDAMPQYDSRIIVSKNHVNMTDLAALTAETGVEFAMFTKGGDRLIIRGDSYSVNVDIETAQKLAEEGYKWSGHTHPGLDTFVLQASEGDYLILKQFKQKVSVIYNAKGDFRTFDNK